jgi:hypothetical protein
MAGAFSLVVAKRLLATLTVYQLCIEPITAASQSKA